MSKRDAEELRKRCFSFLLEKLEVANLLLTSCYMTSVLLLCGCTMPSFFLMVNCYEAIK